MNAGDEKVYLFKFQGLNVGIKIDNGHKALCPLSRLQNPGIMLDDGAGIHAWYMQ